MRVLNENTVYEVDIIRYDTFYNMIVAQKYIDEKTTEDVVMVNCRDEAKAHKVICDALEKGYCDFNAVERTGPYFK